MPIICVVVLKLDGRDVLSTSVNPDASSSFDTSVVAQQLSTADLKANRRSFLTHGAHTIFFTSTDGVVLAAACDADVAKKTAYDFLEAAKKKFTLMYTEPTHMLSADTCRDFDTPAVELLQEHSAPDAGRQTMDKIHNDLNQVKEVMAQNIDKVLERGEKLDYAVGQSEELGDCAVEFHRAARRVRRKMWWQNLKFKLLLGGGVVFVALMIAMFACGGPTFSDC